MVTPSYRNRKGKIRTENMDKSLDDIIKERKLSVNVRRGRGSDQNSIAWVGRGRLNKQTTGKRGQGVRQAAPRRNLQPITDAREKLIAKTRGIDAREKLIKKAKLTDARVRLNAKREKAGPLDSGDAPPKRGGLKRTISNPKKQSNQPLQLSVQNDSPQTRFTIQNSSAQERFTVRGTSSNISLRKRISPPRKSPPRGGLQLVVSNPPRNTFRSGVSLGSTLQQSSKPSPVTLRSTAAMDNPRLSFREAPKVQRIGGSSLSETSGPLRLAGPIRRPSSLEGTRVVISNLHTTVTEDDIKELFGALGVLKRVRMIKQGLAEVIYSKRESALKAISTYHNRELDGKAMQCRLDTGAAEAGTVVKKNAISDRFKTYSSENNPTLPYKSTIPPSTIVELGDDIVNKVLFKLPVTSASTSKPVIFTVKI